MHQGVRVFSNWLTDVLSFEPRMQVMQAPCFLQH